MEPVKDTHRKLEALIERQQVAASRDLGRFGLGLGAAMVLAAGGLMLQGVAFAFSLTCLVWGALLAAISLWSRVRSQRSQVEHSRLLKDLHEESTRLQHRYAVIQKLWDDGLPTDCSVADVFLLLEAKAR